MKEEKSHKLSFIQLLGETQINNICDNNWVEFCRKPFSIYKRNEVEMKFLKQDNKGDTVIFFSICYNEDSKKWICENSYDSHSIEHDTFEELLNHVYVIKEICNNDKDYYYVKFPNL